MVVLLLVVNTSSRGIRVISLAKQGSYGLTAGVIVFYCVLSGENIFRAKFLKSMLGVLLLFITMCCYANTLATALLAKSCVGGFCESEDVLTNYSDGRLSYYC